MDDSQKPKRRPRYKGTHPRGFQEKYKELNPEIYSKDVEKIKSRGATPAGTHRPICVDEILEVLDPKPGETALDATLGYGGHATALLRRIMPGGTLIAFDQDPIERPKTEARLRALGIAESALIIAPTNFRNVANFLGGRGMGGVDMALADLGVSSMQIDDPARGFSYKIEAPLDLRMNPGQGETAASLLTHVSEADLVGILVENADEPFAGPIAKALLRHRPKTTTQTAAVIRAVMTRLPPRLRQEEGDNPVRRTFQALRIAVNDELSALDQFLEDLPAILNPGGRVAILSFHSGEDRRVKKRFQALERAKIFRKVAPTPIRPGFQEQRDNPRSSSAKLRWAVKSTIIDR